MSFTWEWRVRPSVNGQTEENEVDTVPSCPPPPTIIWFGRCISHRTSTRRDHRSQTQSFRPDILGGIQATTFVRRVVRGVHKVHVHFHTSRGCASWHRKCSCCWPSGVKRDRSVSMYVISLSPCPSWCPLSLTRRRWHVKYTQDGGMWVVGNSISKGKTSIPSTSSFSNLFTGF